MEYKNMEGQKQESHFTYTGYQQAQQIKLRLMQVTNLLSDTIQNEDCF